MNPILNPVTGLPFLAHYLRDPGRIVRYSSLKMARFRDVRFRQLVRYAATVPLYRDAFNAASVDVSGIHGIKDIAALPFVSKEDLVKGFPDATVPTGYDRRRASIVSTGGSTGKPLSMFTDFSVFSEGIGASVRHCRRLGCHPRRSRIANIGNFNEGKPDAVTYRELYANAQATHMLRNMRFISVFTPMVQIMEQLNAFRPDVIYTYPNTLQDLSRLKRMGFGDQVAPKVLISSGCVLDEYTKSCAEDAFHCPVVNTYGSTESGDCAVAMECLEGTWHVNYDYFHVEVVDGQNAVLPEGERGRLVLTRLFGKATPIVRYTGMEDWVTLRSEEDCACGLRTPAFDGGVAGRLSTSIITPDGTVYPAASFADIHMVLVALQTQKVQQYQIIQHSLHDIEIDLVIDDDLRAIGPSVDVIIEEIRKIHQKKTGPQVKVSVKEVQSIPSLPNKPAPLIVSRLSEAERDAVLQRAHCWKTDC